MNKPMSNVIYIKVCEMMGKLYKELFSMFLETGEGRRVQALGLDIEKQNVTYLMDIPAKNELNSWWGIRKVEFNFGGRPGDKFYEEPIMLPNRHKVYVDLNALKSPHISGLDSSFDIVVRWKGRKEKAVRYSNLTHIESNHYELNLYGAVFDHSNFIAFRGFKELQSAVKAKVCLCATYANYRMELMEMTEKEIQNYLDFILALKPDIFGQGITSSLWINVAIYNNKSIGLAYKKLKFINDYIMQVTYRRPGRIYCFGRIDVHLNRLEYWDSYKGVITNNISLNFDPSFFHALKEVSNNIFKVDFFNVI